jgi:ribosomal protein S11
MDEHLSSAAQAVFDRYEASREPFHEHELASTVQSAAGPADALTPEQRHAVWSEISALYFMPSSKPGGSIWGTYFAPMMSGTTKDGVEVHNPDITQADEATISYWASRSNEARHPILRARYADLVWDFTALVAKRRPDVTFARAAIDAYAEAIENQIYFHDTQAEDFAARALSLALSINDKARVQRVKDGFFALHTAIGDVTKRGLWWMLFDDLYNSPGVALTDTERKSIIDGLEHVLQVATDRSQGHFDPWAAQGAAERLERHYRQAGQMPEVHRVVRAYGQAFESAANDANAMLAVAWLQPVFDKYHDVGMGDDARRVHQVLEKRGLEAQAGIKKVEIPLRIKPADVDRFADALTDGDLQQALKRIGIKFVPRADEVRSLNERMKTRYYVANATTSAFSLTSRHPTICGWPTLMSFPRSARSAPRSQDASLGWSAS